MITIFGSDLSRVEPFFEGNGISDIRLACINDRISYRSELP